MPASLTRDKPTCLSSELCMSTCVCECLCACVSVCAHVCFCVCVHACLCARVYMSACVQMYTYHTCVITAQNFPAIISRFKGHLMFGCVQEKVCCLPLFHNRSPKNLTDNSSTTKTLLKRWLHSDQFFPRELSLSWTETPGLPPEAPPPPHPLSASVPPVGSHPAHSFLLKKYASTPLDSDWKSEATRLKNYSLRWGPPKMCAKSSQILCEEAQGWSGFKVSFVTSALRWS